LFVEAAEHGVVVEDVPEAVCDLLEADLLAVQGLRQAPAQRASR